MERMYFKAMKVIEYLAVSLILIATFIIIIQVIARYGLNSSLTWADEVLGFLLVWITFIGAALAMNDNSHISTDILMEIVPSSLKWAANILIDCFVLVFLIVFVWFSSVICTKMFENYTVSITIRMAYVYSILPIAGVFMILSVLRRIAFHLTKQSPKET